MKNGRILLIFILAFLSSIGGYLLPMAIPWLGQLELRVFDLHANQALRVPANNRIIVIGIADDTFRNLATPSNVVPRKYHAELIRLLDGASAKTLVFDIFFIGETTKADDKQMQLAISSAKHLNIVLAREAQLAAEDPAQLSGARIYFSDVQFGDGGNPHVEIGMAYPFQPDFIFRGIYAVLPDWSNVPKQPLQHIALSAYALDRGLHSSDFRFSTRDRRLSIKGDAWELGVDGELEIRFLRDGDDFEFYEYTEALAALRDPVRSLRFRDKIVFLGYVTGKDEMLTPVGRQHGPVFNAQALNSLMASVNKPLRRVPGYMVFGTCFLVALVGILCFWPAKPLRTGTLILVCLAALWLGPPLLLSAYTVWLPTVSPATSLLLALLIGAVAQAISSDRFIPSFVRRNRVADMEEMVVVLFADVVGSTALVGSVGDEHGRAILAEALRVLTKAVTRAGGEVEKTQGDGLLAVFRKSESSMYISQSFAAVRLMKLAVAELDEHLIQSGKGRLQLSFGLEEGTISGRETESQGRREWGIFGITIHLAARLQAECKNQGQEVLIGPRLAKSAEQDIALLPVTPFIARGFKEPVQPFAILELNNEH